MRAGGSPTEQRGSLMGNEGVVFTRHEDAFLHWSPTYAFQPIRLHQIIIKRFCTSKGAHLQKSRQRLILEACNNNLRKNCL